MKIKKQVHIYLFSLKISNLLAVHVSIQEARILRVSDNFSLDRLRFAGIVILQPPIVAAAVVLRRRRSVVKPISRFSFDRWMLMLRFRLIVAIRRLDVEGVPSIH